MMIILHLKCSKSVYFYYTLFHSRILVIFIAMSCLLCSLASLRCWLHLVTIQKYQMKLRFSENRMYFLFHDLSCLISFLNKGTRKNWTIPPVMDQKILKFSILRRWLDARETWQSLRILWLKHCEKNNKCRCWFKRIMV